MVFFVVLDLVAGLEDAIQKVKNGTVVPPLVAHEKIRSMYSWHDITRRTEIVYNNISQNREPLLYERLRKLVLQI